MKWQPNMIMRASQKKRMSKPVINNVLGKKTSRSRVFSGQPSVVNGSRPDENQVSSTSETCSNFVLPHFGHFAGASRATITSLQLSQVQAGMRWPHHNWREMHQS